MMTLDDFTAAISQRLGCDPSCADTILRAVMATVRDGLSDGEARQVADYLPGAISQLIPDSSGERPELPETGGRSFLAMVRARAGLESDSAAGRAVRATFDAMLQCSGVAGQGGAWDGLRHLPRELKSIWMRIFRTANFPVERLVQRP
jgi:uncharacterized protein (DUF2267 family)